MWSLIKITDTVFWLLSLLGLLPGLIVQWFIGKAVLSPGPFAAMIAHLLRWRQGQRRPAKRFLQRQGVRPRRQLR